MMYRGVLLQGKSGISKSYAKIYAAIGTPYIVKYHNLFCS